MGTTWDDICKSVDGWTKKANRKVEQLTETAAIRIKISARKSEMEDAYLELGKLTYESMTSTEENETPDEAVAAKVAEITALKDEIATLEQKIEKNEEGTED
jgi:ubiquinone biosynthesis protein UbiJ